MRKCATKVTGPERNTLVRANFRIELQQQDPAATMSGTRGRQEKEWTAQNWGLRRRCERAELGGPAIVMAGSLSGLDLATR